VSRVAVILCLGFAAFTAWNGLAAAPPAAPAAKKAPAPQRIALFTGNGTSGWLPKTKILPTAADIETQAQKLSSRMRNMDPFALPTFPRPEDMVVAKTEVVRSAQKVTLNEALQSLNVTGINLQKKEILFRGRNVFEGDVMVLSFKDEVFLAQVVEISPTQILFRDVKRQETGVLPHSLVPHLELEPMQQRPGMAGLEGKMTPMETSNQKRP
jgi:hypothetical protein